MKRAVPAALLLTVLMVLAGPLAAQEESAYDVEGWKRRVASPTYGIAVGFLVPSDDSGELDPVPMPGLELRIFNGMNVAKRGGFYTGYEVGTFFFGTKSDTLTLNAGGQVYLEGMAATVFLLSKYGYRLDLGLKAAGLSVGAELGIGGQMNIGGIDVYNADTDQSVSADSQIPFSVMLDAAAEGAFRFGQNFRIFARVGASLLPPMFDGSWNDPASVGEYFSITMTPVIISARLGFALNY
jgi:hypothetical protein